MVIRQEQYFEANRVRYFRITNEVLNNLNIKAHKDLKISRDITMEDVKRAIEENCDVEVTWNDGTFCYLTDYIMDFISDLMDDECAEDWHYYNEYIHQDFYSIEEAGKE